MVAIAAETQPAAAAVFVDGETTPPEASTGIVRGLLDQVSFAARRPTPIRIYFPTGRFV